MAPFIALVQGSRARDPSPEGGQRRAQCPPAGSRKECPTRRGTRPCRRHRSLAEYSSEPIMRQALRKSGSGDQGRVAQDYEYTRRTTSKRTGQMLIDLRARSLPQGHAAANIPPLPWPPTSISPSPTPRPKHRRPSDVASACASPVLAVDIGESHGPLTPPVWIVFGSVAEIA